MKIEKYLRKEGDPDIVSYLELALYVKGKEDSEIVRIPLGPESKELTFYQLGEYCDEYYLSEIKREDTYGYAYRIDEIEPKD